MGSTTVQPGPGDGSRARVVARGFGVSAPRAAWAGQSPDLDDLPRPAAGQVILINGPSGAGKSSMLRGYWSRLPRRRRVDLTRVRLAERAVIELFPEMGVESALLLLSRVGLAEAHTYLLPPSRLSDGQRWRLRLAMAMARAEARGGGPMFVAADEFAALLDRVTAWVVARALRKAVDRKRMLGAVVATSHEDLLEPLRPEVVLRCDFGRVAVERRGETAEAS